MVSAEAPAEIFSGGGKRCIYYLLDQRKLYCCNQDFAKGLEPRVKMILFKKLLQLGGMLSKLLQFKYITDGGLGAKPPVTGQWTIS